MSQTHWLATFRRQQHLNVTAAYILWCLPPPSELWPCWDKTEKMSLYQTGCWLAVSCTALNAAVVSKLVFLCCCGWFWWWEQIRGEFFFIILNSTYKNKNVLGQLWCCSLLLLLKSGGISEMQKSRSFIFTHTRFLGFYAEYTAFRNFSGGTKKWWTPLRRAHCCHGLWLVLLKSAIHKWCWKTIKSYM